MTKRKPVGEANTESRAEGTRPKRVPIHKRKILDAPQREGYVRRFVNDELGRIQMFLEAGWTFVCSENTVREKRAQDASNLGSAERVVVNRDPHARSNTAVLMEIKEEWYNESQAYMQDQVDRTEASYDPAKMQGVYGEFKKT